MREEEGKVEEFLPRRPRLATLYILYDEIGHVTCGCGMEWLSDWRLANPTKPQVAKRTYFSLTTYKLL